MSSVSDVPSQAISQSRQPLLLIDRDKFRQNFNKRNFILSHRLCGNPLFSLPRIIELAGIPRFPGLTISITILVLPTLTSAGEPPHPASRSMRRSGASRRLAPGLPSSAPNMILPMPSCLRTACPPDIMDNSLKSYTSSSIKCMTPHQFIPHLFLDVPGCCETLLDSNRSAHALPKTRKIDELGKRYS